MDFIRSWVLTISLSSFASALIYFLLPKGNVEKAARTAISIFILTIVISPLFKIQGLNLLDHKWDEEGLEAEINEQAENIRQAAEEQFRHLVTNSTLAALKEKGFEDISIEVITMSNERGEISVFEIHVLSDVENRERKSQIQEIIRQETGLKPILKKGDSHE